MERETRPKAVRQCPNRVGLVLVVAVWAEPTHLDGKLAVEVECEIQKRKTRRDSKSQTLLIHAAAHAVSGIGLIAPTPQQFDGPVSHHLDPLISADGHEHFVQPFLFEERGCAGFFMLSAPRHPPSSGCPAV